MNLCYMHLSKYRVSHNFMINHQVPNYFMAIRIYPPFLGTTLTLFK